MMTITPEVLADLREARDRLRSTVGHQIAHLDKGEGGQQTTEYEAAKALSDAARSRFYWMVTLYADGLFEAAQRGLEAQS